MGWRTVIVESRAKIAYKNGYIVLKKEQDVMLHISEIDVLILATTQVSFTCVAVNELIKNKIKVIFCDEKHNPLGEIVPYYGAHNTSKKIKNQIRWQEEIKDEVFAKIIIQKILNQANVLKKYGKVHEYEKLLEYSSQVLPADVTNREGHSAKVYFNALFGMSFSRNSNMPINFALDYGYSVLLSYISREIVSNGYLTQLGINHTNEFNQFNLSCDLIEPFRPIVDDFVVSSLPITEFNSEYKRDIVGLLNKKTSFQGQLVYLSNAITVSVKSILDALDSESLSKLKLYEF